MKKFLKRAAIFCIIFLVYKASVIFLFINAFLPAQHIDYTYFGYNDASKAKIVLAGSSNLRFNYDYDSLNAHFDDYTVIGSSLSEPSGLFASIYKLKQLDLGKADKVVFCLPHSLFESEKLLPLSKKKPGVSKALLREAFEQFPFLTVKNGLTISPLNMIKARKDSFLSSPVFEGKPVFQNEAKYKACWTTEKDKFNIYSQSFEEEYLVDILEWLDDSFDCELLFRFPALKEHEFQLNEERIAFLSKNLRFINSLEDAVYDDSLWYDQWYHLNGCGKEVCSGRFVLEMSGVL